MAVADGHDEQLRRRNMSEHPQHTVDPLLLELLVCPQTKETLHYDTEKQELQAKGSRLAYPIRDGVPIMLPEEARRMSDEEAAAL